MSQIKDLELPFLDRLSTTRFVLASTSPRRLEILQQMGIKNIEVIPSNFEENLDKSKYTPEEYVLHTAMGKAQSIHEQLGSETSTVILSADTILTLNGRVFEKPKSKEDQLQTLKLFRDSGEHTAITAVIVIYEGKTYTNTTHTKIRFDQSVTDEFLEAYVESGEGWAVAGGYRVQMRGALMMSGIEGDYYNVVGLPMRDTWKLLERALKV